MSRVTESSSPVARRHAIAALVIVLGVVGFAAARRARRVFAPSPSAEQCARLVDLYVEQAARQRNPEARAEEIAHAVEEARGSRDHQRDVSECGRRLTRAQVECGLAAPSVDVLERCIQ
jgi:hypothetical protein